MRGPFPQMAGTWNKHGPPHPLRPRRWAGSPVGAPPLPSPHCILPAASRGPSLRSVGRSPPSLPVRFLSPADPHATHHTWLPPHGFPHAASNASRSHEGAPSPPERGGGRPPAGIPDHCKHPLRGMAAINAMGPGEGKGAFGQARERRRSGATQEPKRKGQGATTGQGGVLYGAPDPLQPHNPNPFFNQSLSLIKPNQNSDSQLILLVFFVDPNEGISGIFFCVKIKTLGVWYFI